MTHDELLAKIDEEYSYSANALRAVVELHSPTDNGFWCELCISSAFEYPCPTIQAIEKELS